MSTKSRIVFYSPTVNEWSDKAREAALQKRKTNGPKTHAGTGAKIGVATGLGSSALRLARGHEAIGASYRALRGLGASRGKAGALLAGGALLGTGLNAAVHSGIGAGIGALIRRRKPQE